MCKIYHKYISYIPYHSLYITSPRFWSPKRSQAFRSLLRCAHAAGETPQLNQEAVSRVLRERNSVFFLYVGKILKKNMRFTSFAVFNYPLVNIYRTQGKIHMFSLGKSMTNNHFQKQTAVEIRSHLHWNVKGFSFTPRNPDPVSIAHLSYSHICT